jgi:hypothetical protein
MKKRPKPEKWVPPSQRTKKAQKKYNAQKRGFPVPPSQIHKSVKDYDRNKNPEIVDDSDEWEDDDYEQ